MNHMKQFFMRPLAVLMAFLMLISVVPVDTWAVPTNTPATTSDEATVPEGLEYEINGEEVTITDYTGSATELIIPDEIEGYPVTSIESYAFYYSESLVSIDVPASIATIGRRAFPEYYQLSDVYYRGTKSQFAAINLDGIQQGFQEALYQVTVHCLDGVYTMVSISTYLDNIYVADGKTVDITIEASGDGLTYDWYIKKTSDSDFSCASDFLGDTFTVTMNSEWDLCELYCVVTDQYGMSDQTNTTVLYMVRADGLLYRISNGEATITGYIGNAAELVIPETIEDCPVTEIYEHAFGESGAECTTLESVYIPASVTDMDRGAFSFCPNLTSVTISEDNTVYTAIDNVVYTNAGTQLVFCAGGKTGSFAIPNTVTTISERAFEGCEKLETISIPNSVTTIKFSAFEECDSLTSLTIPESVTSIGSSFAYHCDSLSEVIWKSTVDTIPGHAFYGCGALDTLTMPKTVTIIDYEATIFCAIEDIYYNGTMAECGAIEIRTNNQGFKHADIHCTDGVIPGEHYYMSSFPTVTEPTCTEQGYTTRICPCGYHWNYDYTDPLGHDWDGMTCTRCGAVNIPFTDVSEGSYCYDPVIWAMENGITNGTTPTTFSPNDPCTRWQIVTFLWRAAGCPEPTSMEHNFKDIPSGSFYLKAVLWAVENGITNGTTATTFSPNDICTRWQIVTFLWRYAGCPEPSSTEHSFTDVSSSSVYYKAMLWAVEEGITNGTTTTTFAPNNPCTRGQIVTFLYRYIVE